jgi:cell division control protein 7
MSSDDLGGYQEPGIHEYRSHVKQLMDRSTTKGVNGGYIDLDEGMSDDELAIHPDVDVVEPAEVNEECGDEEEAEGEPGREVDDMDSDVDVLSDDSECETLALKPPNERLEIISEITQLIKLVPALSPLYQIFDRLGTGTFSSVYKAIDLSYSSYYNAPWQGHHPLPSSAYYQSKLKSTHQNAFVAIKRIYVTSSPERIRNEITIMEDCRGCRHVSQLITAFRHEDQVVAIMPYHKNDDFRVRFVPV